MCVCVFVVVAKRNFQMVCQEKTERAGQRGRGRKQAEAVAEPEAGTDTARSLVATGGTHTYTQTHTLTGRHTHTQGGTLHRPLSV